jgi:hypothetical protein
VAEGFEGSVMVSETEADWKQILAETFDEVGVEATFVDGSVGAIQAINRNNEGVGLVVTAAHNGQWRRVVHAADQAVPPIPVVVLSGSESMQAAIEDAGARFINKNGPETRSDNFAGYLLGVELGE